MFVSLEEQVFCMQYLVFAKYSKCSEYSERENVADNRKYLVHAEDSKCSGALCTTNAVRNKHTTHVVPCVRDGACYGNTSVSNYWGDAFLDAFCLFLVSYAQ